MMVTTLANRGGPYSFVIEHCISAKGHGRRGCTLINRLSIEIRGNSRSLSTCRKQKSRNCRRSRVHSSELPSRCSWADNGGGWDYLPTLSPSRIASPYQGDTLLGRCGCGFRTEYSPRTVSSRSSLCDRFIKVLDRCLIARLDRKRKLVSFEHAAKHRQLKRVTQRNLSPEFVRTRDGRRAVTSRQSRFSTKDNVDDGVCKAGRTWRIISAAAAACVYLTVCSSTVASPITDRPELKDLQMHVETLVRSELQAQIKVQKEGLDEIGEPLEEWSIDDRTRKILEENSRSRLDEDGRAVSQREILESEVVPLFKPSVVFAQKKDKAVRTVEIAQETTLQEKVAESSKRCCVARQSGQSSTLTQREATNGAPELVAVATIPLGSVFSATNRTLGSASVMAAVQAGSGTGTGVSFLTRIVMHFSGGGLAGVMGATLVYPLDTIKTRMQAQCNKDGGEIQYKDEWDCLLQLITEEGPASLYSGLLPQLIGIAPEKAMKLTVNEVLMEMLERQMPGVGVWVLEFIAGGGGGFSQVVFTNPMEIVKVRLQTQSKDGKSKNTWDVIKELGVQGLYNGSTMTMARDIPSSAVFFAIYTLIRQVYPDQDFMAGFVAAIPATVLVTPFDVVKTRLQMERTAGEDPYKNGYHCLFLILQEEGLGALFKGSVARVLKTSPQFGITLMLYNLFCSKS